MTTAFKNSGAKFKNLWTRIKELRCKLKAWKTDLM